MCTCKRLVIATSVFILVVLLLVGIAVAAFKLNYPTPPLQTETQKEVFAAKSREAAVASEAATPQVLAFFDSAGFRSAIRGCCPEAAKMSSTDLLNRFRSEAQVAELAHALPSEVAGIFTLDLISNLFDFFPNDWQYFVFTGQYLAPMDKAEQGLYGCPPFANGKPTWSEASNRMMYIAQNMRRLDTGSAPNFGDISIVMNHRTLKDAVLINPMDTGVWEGNCNYTSRCTTDIGHTGKLVEVCVHPDNFDCNAWPKAKAIVGTLQYLDHLILPNLEFFVPQNQSSNISKVYSEAQMLFRRSAFAGNYEEIAETNIVEANRYWEANILANPRLSSDIKFVIGNFASLFGTANGRKLQRIAEYYSWPVVWSYGLGTTAQLAHSNADFPGNKRILDPSSASILHNFPQSKNVIDNFEAVWSQVARDRAAAATSVTGTWAELEKAGSWAELEKSQVRVAPLTALACPTEAECIGTDIVTNVCLCKAVSTTLVSSLGRPARLSGWEFLLVLTSIVIAIVAFKAIRLERRSNSGSHLQASLLETQ